MVAVNVRNCAHIINTPAAISWSGLMISDVKANPTAAKKLSTATSFSCLRLFMLMISIRVRNWSGNFGISP